MPTSGDRLLSGLDLTVALEHLLPILDQQIERFLRGALVGHDVVMHTLLHVEQQFGIGGLRPEVLDDTYRRQEVSCKGRTLREARVVQDRLVAGIATKRPPLL